MHRYNIKMSKPTIAAMMTRVSASMMAAYAGFPRDEAMMLRSKLGRAGSRRLRRRL